MKRLLISLLITAAAITNASAYNNFYADFGWTFIDANKAKQQNGPTWALAWGFHKDFNFLYRGAGTSFKENPNLSNEITYNTAMHLGGIEYMYHLPDFHSHWKTALLVGYFNSKISEKSSSEKSDNGVGFLITTGILYDLTQHISIFADVGYQSPVTYEGALKDYKLGGFTFLAGVRFSFYPNRDLGSEY